jgi:predicted alpha/beta hydrolase family esterase
MASYRSFDPASGPAAGTPLVLLVPGSENGASFMRDWERERVDARLLRLGLWDAPHRNTWVNKLNLAIRRADRPVVLVAEGIACLAAAWWAEYEQPENEEAVVGALLVLPPDVDRPGADPRLARFGACPRTALPFPSYLVAGPGETPELRRSLSQLARDWNAQFVSDEIGSHGWPQGQWLLDRLIRCESHNVAETAALHTSTARRLDPPLFSSEYRVPGPFLG